MVRTTTPWPALAGLLLLTALAGCRPQPGAPPRATGPAATSAAIAKGPALPAVPATHASPRTPEGSPAVSGAASATPAPPGSSYDWSVPALFRSHTLRNYKRKFPEKLLALTFDDGPGPSVTPVVLAALKKYHAHATFFVLGDNARRFPELVRQAAEEGHCVGIHSYSHIAKCTPELAVKNLHLTAEYIEQATGKKPTVFRPPYGILTNELTKLARREGYPVVLWSMSAADTDMRILKDPVLIARNVIHTPRNGDFVLMHDSSGHMATAKALSQILPELTKAGWKFVTIPELLRAWAEWMATQPPKVMTASATSLPLEGPAERREQTSASARREPGP